MRWSIYFFIFCFFCHGRAADYKAAVLEYYPESKNTSYDTIASNIEEYRKIANTARSQGIDIIVFPEYGLTALDALDNPEQYSVEVSNENHFIKELSAMAMDRQLFMVVNLLEKENKDGKFDYYNTNLVFDRNGSIILKYRKINLSNETKLTQGSENQNFIFKTDFGVTFGIFTSSDILFNTPSRILLDAGVTDVVFPTAWISQTPFLVSLSVQHGYATANGVNLLAANLAKPSDGRGGSGIYLADGTILETYIGDSASTKLIIQKVQKLTSRLDKTICSSKQQFGLPDDNTNKSNVSNYNTQISFEASKYQFKDIDLTQNFTVTQVCDREFCCTFELGVNSSENSTDVYKVMAFDGIQSFNNKKSHVRICSLVACKSESANTCGIRAETTTNFSKLIVRGNLPVDNTSYYAPVTLNNLLLPMRNIQYCNDNNDTNTSFVQLIATKQDRVLTFGFIGKTDVLLPDSKSTVDDDPSNNCIISSRSSLFLIISILVTKLIIIP